MASTAPIPDNNQNLRLLLPKEVCSWTDLSALRRCALRDNYLTAKISPSGKYVYFVYTYEVMVFNVFCGTRKEFSTSTELVTYIPITDVTGYMINLMNGDLTAREVRFDFASGLVEEISKHTLLSNCEKIKDIDCISYQVADSLLVVLYQNAADITNFTCFRVGGNWEQPMVPVVHFADGDFTRFPCARDQYAYAFPNRRVNTIKQAAKQFSSICEVNPRIASTIPVPDIAGRAQEHLRQVHREAINEAGPARPFLHRIADQLPEARRIGFAQMFNLADINRQFGPPLPIPPIPQVPPPDEQLEQLDQPAPPHQNRNEAPAGLPLRHRILPLHNDLTCVNIPKEIENLQNFLEKYEFQWIEDRLYLLWSVCIAQPTLQRMTRNVGFSLFDYDVVSDFFNFFAIFDLKTLTWYPIQIDALSPKTDSPLLMFITEDEFLTLFVSQLSQPFRWSRLRNAIISPHSSILAIDKNRVHHSLVYRIPMKSPDSLLNLCQSAFNRMYPSWTSLSHEQLEKLFGKFIAYDHLFYNEKDALMDLYVFELRKLGSMKPKPTRPLA